MPGVAPGDWRGCEGAWGVAPGVRPSHAAGIRHRKNPQVEEFEDSPSHGRSSRLEAGNRLEANSQTSPCPLPEWGAALRLSLSL